MSVICPTVTTDNLAEYAVQLRKAEALSARVHLDVSDGQFSPSQLVPVSELWWDYPLTVDIHVMHQRPDELLEQLIKLKPQMVIIHAEAEVHHALFAAQLHRAGIRAGLAILQTTPIERVENEIVSFDHLLIFSGDLGHFGGTADLALLDKVAQAKVHHPEIEIGWDGGINKGNIRQLLEGGVDVFNVGGYIQKAEDPRAAYATLEANLGGNE